MSSHDEPTQPDPADIIDMAFPGDESPVEMDAFIQRLETLADEEHAPDGTTVETATQAVDAVQDAFPTADVALDSAPEADIGLRVIGATGDTTREHVESIVDNVLSDMHADIAITLVREPRESADSDEAESSATGGVIL